MGFSKKLHKGNHRFPVNLRKYSNPKTAQLRAYKYLGRTAKIYPASRKHKKYKIFDPKHQKWVNFGQLGYEDYTKHKDKSRRKNYLARSTNMNGDWKNNPYSANNLSIHILW